MQGTLYDIPSASALPNLYTSPQSHTYSVFCSRNGYTVESLNKPTLSDAKLHSIFSNSFPQYYQQGFIALQEPPPQYPVPVPTSLPDPADLAQFYNTIYKQELDQPVPMPLPLGTSPPIVLPYDLSILLLLCNIHFDCPTHHRIPTDSHFPYNPITSRVPLNKVLDFQDLATFMLTTNKLNTNAATSTYTTIRHPI